MWGRRLRGMRRSPSQENTDCHGRILDAVIEQARHATRKGGGIAQASTRLHAQGLIQWQSACGMDLQPTSERTGNLNREHRDFAIMAAVPFVLYGAPGSGATPVHAALTLIGAP